MKWRLDAMFSPYRSYMDESKSMSTVYWIELNWTGPWAIIGEVLTTSNGMVPASVFCCTKLSSSPLDWSRIAECSKQYLIPGCRYRPGPSLYPRHTEYWTETNLADLEVKCGDRFVPASRTYVWTMCGQLTNGGLRSWTGSCINERSHE